MAAALFSGYAVIATTGTAVQLRSTANTVKWFNIVAPTNSYDIRVGPSTVTTAKVAATAGYLLRPGETLRLGACETNTVYINGTAGDEVFFVAGTN